MSLRGMEDVVSAAISDGLMGEGSRRRLLHGLPMGFVYSLPTVSRPIDQLRLDLMELGRTPRLRGLAEPPLVVWLRNAARIGKSDVYADRLREMGFEVSMASSVNEDAARPVPKPADDGLLPRLERILGVVGEDAVELAVRRLVDGVGS